MKNSMKKIIVFILIVVFLGFRTVVYADTLDCTSYGDVLTDLQNVFDFIKIVVPLLIMGLSSYDFVKAVTAKEDKGVKKAFQTLLKRMACAIILFFLPVLIEFCLELVGINSNVCIK